MMLSMERDFAASSPTQRVDDVRQMLEERRRALVQDIQRRVRSVREEAAGPQHHIAHLTDVLDADPEDDLVFALIQMKGELLQRVAAAVRQCDAGTYGRCTECGDRIALSRLSAMPFAVRCRECEESRERQERETRLWSSRRMRGDSRH